MGRIALFVVFATLLHTANAQALIPADNVTLQPQIGRDERGFSSCGVRAISMVSLGKRTEMFDFSLVIYRGTFGGLIKAGKYILSPSDLQRQTLPKAVTPGPTKFWISADTDGKPLTAQKISPAEDAGFILGLGDLVSTWKTILAISHGEGMQFVVRFPSESYDRVIAFSSSLPAGELKSLNACLSSLYESFKSGTIN
jgi:hypothetical protein